MPEAIVKFSKNLSAQDKYLVLNWGLVDLRRLVAENLGIFGHPEAVLFQDDVGVSFIDPHGQDLMGKYLVSVRVEANDYPERRPIARPAAKAIRDALVAKVPALQDQCYVWVRLSFGEFVD